VRIYTRKGDDGTTGLLYGGRIAKSSARIELNGVVDEAQAAIGAARAEAERGGELDQLLIALERDLYVLMAEIATLPKNRHKLQPGVSLVTAEMVTELEHRIDDLDARVHLANEFVVPGENRVSAALDVARTVVRRAERLVGSLVAHGSFVRPYLNRLSDLLWMAARWQEGARHVAARRRPAARDGRPATRATAARAAARDPAAPSANRSRPRR
jgi:cob(I)alamin adenosyltransferase